MKKENRPASNAQATASIRCLKSGSFSGPATNTQAKNTSSNEPNTQLATRSTARL